MQTAVNRHESRTTGSQGIVYRTICQNPGCGFKFDLKITPQNASLLSGSMPCPHCKRHGGQLKSQGRISEKALRGQAVVPPDRGRTDAQR